MAIFSTFSFLQDNMELANYTKMDELTPTGSMVLQMARLLPKFPDSHYIICMDNYFTSVPLFSLLCIENIGAVGTTRPSSIDFPALLVFYAKIGLPS